MGGGSSEIAGFVLAGGRSSRMGRDKALLLWNGSTLLETAARKVSNATGNVRVIGDPQKYGHLGFPVVADLIPDCGPLGGLYTALKTGGTDWHVLVACDMPNISQDLLRELIRAARTSTAHAVVPETGNGLEPLCAAYHWHLVPAVEAAIQAKFFKMQTFLPTISLERWTVPAAFGPDLFRNLNTPDELTAGSGTGAA